MGWFNHHLANFFSLQNPRRHWGYQFSFKGSQSIAARPSCTKEQLILVLGQAQGREGGETPQKNITLEVGFSHHLKIGGGTFWMIKPYVIKKKWWVHKPTYRKVVAKDFQD